MRKTIIIGLFLFVAANAKIWYVHPDSLLNSIQAGLDSCADNDTVLVAAGMYVENLIWPDTQGIDLVSEYGPDTTIIDGNDTASVITTISGLDSTTVVEGFTIRNGNGFLGGGICAEASSPKVVDNIIINNRAEHGGGIYTCCWSVAIIVDNVITDNLGSGIFFMNAYPTIKGNTISANRDSCGGGISSNSSAPIIINNTITGNIADSIGGGIYCLDGSLVVDSCTISKNDGDGVCFEMGAELSINFCDIYDNIGYGVCNFDSTIIGDAKYNWWGDSTGPYHPDSNPGGLGDSVSDWVDFIPWLGSPVPVVEKPSHRITFDLNIHPNPTRGRFSLDFALDNSSQVKITFYDLTGRKVVNIHDDKLSAGEHRMNAILSEKLSSGIYFLRFETEDIKETEKILLTR